MYLSLLLYKHTHSHTRVRERMKNDPYIIFSVCVCVCVNSEHKRCRSNAPQRLIHRSDHFNAKQTHAGTPETDLPSDR